MQRKTKKRRAHDKRCKVCRGTGQVRSRKLGQRTANEPISEECPECNGEGYMIVGA